LQKIPLETLLSLHSTPTCNDHIKREGRGGSGGWVVCLLTGIVGWEGPHPLNVSTSTLSFKNQVQNEFTFHTAHFIILENKKSTGKHCYISKENVNAHVSQKPLNRGK
jgi:hypothetical protein